MPHAEHVTVTWDPATRTYVDTTTGERWVYVDPASFDNPFPQQAPVYTSGPQPVPVPAQQPPGPGQEIAGAAASGGPTTGEGEPAPGELGLVGRRAWPTWAMVLAVAVALVAGMWINGATGTATASSGKAGYSLPPPAGAPAAAAAGSKGGAPSTPSTTSVGSSPPTTAAPAATAGPAATASTVAPGPPTVLIPATQQSGNWTSSTFTIAAGQWNIGWAFQCTPAPPTAPTFEIFVVTPGGTPGSTPAVSSSAASGQSVTPQSTLGNQEIVVQTTAACRWAVKVTGFSG